MRILVTNDDGIDSIGLHVLAETLQQYGDVVIVAPDREFSGSSVAIGAIWEFVPEVVRHHIDGIDEAWSVNGPPALCVMYARLGAFGDPFDLVVSGINPGANVGRSVYHSGTVGACIGARNAGWSGVAISQATAGWIGVEGQGWGDIVLQQKWNTAAAVAGAFVGGLIKDLPDEPIVANINVPNVEVDQIKGWRTAEVGMLPSRAMASARLLPDPMRPDHYDVDVEWGHKIDLPEGTDGDAVENDYIALTYLSRITAEPRPDAAAAEAALDELLSWAP